MLSLPAYRLSAAGMYDTGSGSGSQSYVHIPVSRSGNRPARQYGHDSLLLYTIPEVKIERSMITFFSEEKKISTPDPVLKDVFSTANLGELISLFTHAGINTSGATGSSSSVFYRGTNSHQTTVRWNGFALNSLTLGTMDLSTIPSAGMQAVSVVHGASGTVAGSGNAGGSILLENSADWDNKINFSLQSELGTFDNQYFSVTGKTGNPTVQYHIFMFSHQAENNFRYTDSHKSGNPVETISNNALDSRGIIQNLFIRLPGGNRLEAGMWYQTREKELPALMGSYLSSQAMQLDSTLRIYAKWTRSGTRSTLSVNTALFDEHMRYSNDNLAGPGNGTHESLINSGTKTTDINYRYWLTDNLSLDGGMFLSSLDAKLASYGGKIRENRAAAVAALKLALPGLTATSSIRKEFHENTRVPLLFSFGARKELIGGLDLLFSYSGQYRVPTFNDKYWQPGGNPDLLPESGYTVDLGLARRVKGNRFRLKMEVNTYMTSLKNMIQWLPSGNGTWWKPSNTREVSVRGIESSVSLRASSGKYDYSMGAAYNYASSVVRRYGERQTAGNQLLYVPGHTGSAYANVYNKRASAGLTGTFTGKRFTSEDNNPLLSMPSFFIVNAHAGYNLRLRDLGGRLQLRVMNLLDTQYQVVRAYPMPGRSFHLGLTIEFNHY